jgi:predicted ATP-grasp superfamily ATP-dependent carboligase
VKIERAKASGDPLFEGLRHVAERASEEILRVGYFGPFGIDVLVVDGQARLIDLNPRFTLGWSIGMGELRTEAIDRALNPKPSA